MKYHPSFVKLILYFFSHMRHLVATPKAVKCDIIRGAQYGLGQPGLNSGPSCIGQVQALSFSAVGGPIRASIK